MAPRINGRPIGAGHPVFVIAEAGVNHNGRMDMALKLIDVAAKAGADAVKFQTFQVDQLNCATTPKAPYQRKGGKDRETQTEMLRKLQLNENHHRVLQRHAKKRGILFLSTPFDFPSLDLLTRLKLPAIKISSGDLTNLPFLKEAARRGKTLILSTGMGSLDEIDDAVRTIKRERKAALILLHCISCYPTPPALANLRTIPFLMNRTGVPIGFSDHSTGFGAAAAAVALGACMIEKHITLNKNLPGPDHPASLEPDELAVFVKTLREAEAAMGRVRKTMLPEERPIARVARKSLVSAMPIPKGVRVTREMIGIKRPGTGISPALFQNVLGKKSRKAIAPDVPLTFAMLGRV
jgi:N-acetylneuraminate synthase/N,N'-diacetyllegionaminate synthase